MGASSGGGGDGVVVGDNTGLCVDKDLPLSQRLATDSPPPRKLTDVRSCCGQVFCQCGADEMGVSLPGAKAVDSSRKAILKNSVSSTEVYETPPRPGSESDSGDDVPPIPLWQEPSEPVASLSVGFASPIESVHTYNESVGLSDVGGRGLGKVGVDGETRVACVDIEDAVEDEVDDRTKTAGGVCIDNTAEVEANV